MGSSQEEQRKGNNSLNSLGSLRENYGEVTLAEVNFSDSNPSNVPRNVHPSSPSPVSYVVPVAFPTGRRSPMSTTEHRQNGETSTANVKVALVTQTPEKLMITPSQASQLSSHNSQPIADLMNDSSNSQVQLSSPVQIQTQSSSCIAATVQGHAQADNNVIVKHEDQEEMNESDEYSVHSDEEENPEWPLPTRCAENVVDTASFAGGILSADPEMWVLESWSNACHNQETESRLFNMRNSTDFQIYHDVTFKIGPEETSASGHKLIFSVICESEALQNDLNKKGDLVIRLPLLDHAAFLDVIQYAYTGNIELKNTSNALKVLEVAKSLGIPELQTKCSAFLQSRVNCQNVVALFCYALESKDENLRDVAPSFITRYTLDVLTSEAFLKLSKENLHSFLQSDDWSIVGADELEVFKAVIRWATHRIRSTCQLEKQKRPSGSDLREVIGPALYHIRLSSLDNPNTFWCKMNMPYQGLFTSEEVIAVSTYLAAKSGNMPDLGASLPTLPLNFNEISRNKIQDNVNVPTSTTEGDDDVRNVFANFDQDENSAISDDGILGENVPQSIQPSLNENSLVTNDGETNIYYLPAKKKRRYDSVATNESVPSPSPAPLDETLPSSRRQSRSERRSSINCLHVFAKSLGNDSEGIEEIRENVKIPTIPKYRVYLPNLKEFHLDLVANRNFECGSVLKTFIDVFVGYFIF